MGYINVFVGSNVYCNIQNNQLTLSKKNSNDQISYPLEDLNSVVFDNLLSTISIKTLSELSNNNVIVYFCDEKHIPQIYLLSYNAFYKNLNIYKKQVNAKKPFLKNIWKKIIAQKIENQSRVLGYLNKNNDLIKLKDSLKSGDSTNIEAVAAREYFKILFGNDFNRKCENIRLNGALNYGYAIVRGAIARSVVAHGLQPYLGIFHCNELNNFNLVDDLIEVFRPIIDYYVYENMDIFSNDLDHEAKMRLLNILNLDMLWKDKKYCVAYLIDCYVSEFVTCLETNNENIITPQIINLEIHKYE